MKSLIRLFALLSILLPTMGTAQLLSAGHHALAIRDTSGGVIARAGALGFSDSGYGLASDGTPVAVGSLPELMPPLGLSTPVTRDALEAAAEAWIRDHAENLASRLATYMRTHGLSSAWYSYERSVTVTTSTGPVSMTLTWALLQDGHGRASYGAPQIAPSGAANARILYVRYYAYSMPTGMEGYSNPRGGELHWQVLDAALNPISGAAGSVQTFGAFDVPLDVSGSEEDLRCLLDSSQADCLTATHDVKKLVASTGANLAVIDYSYSPEPRYEYRSDGFCPNGAGTCFVPSLVEYRYTARELAYSNCGDDVVYRNAGEIRNGVERITDRYVADALDLDARHMQRYRESLDFLAKPFDWQIVPATGAAGFSPASPYVIEPYTGGAIVTVNTLPHGQVTALADIESLGETSCPPVTASVSPSSHNVKTSRTFMVTAGGGKPPYTYHWRPVVDYANGTISIGSPSLDTTTISRSGPTLGPPGGVVGYVDVTVTDSRGTSATARVTLTIDPDPPPLQIHIDESQTKWNSTYNVRGIEAQCSSNSDSSCTVTTAPAPVSVSGGSGSYSVTWSRRTGANASLSSPSSTRTSFSRTGSAPLEGVFRVSVWDGLTTATEEIAVSTRHCILSCPTGYTKNADGKCQRTERVYADIPSCPAGYRGGQVFLGPSIACIADGCTGWGPTWTGGCPYVTVSPSCPSNSTMEMEYDAFSVTYWCRRTVETPANNSCS